MRFEVELRRACPENREATGFVNVFWRERSERRLFSKLRTWRIPLLWRGGKIFAENFDGVVLKSGKKNCPWILATIGVEILLLRAKTWDCFALLAMTDYNGKRVWKGKKTKACASKKLKASNFQLPAKNTNFTFIKNLL